MTFDPSVVAFNVNRFTRSFLQFTHLADTVVVLIVAVPPDLLIVAFELPTYITSHSPSAFRRPTRAGCNQRLSQFDLLLSSLVEDRRSITVTLEPGTISSTLKYVLVLSLVY